MGINEVDACQRMSQEEIVPCNRILSRLTVEKDDRMGATYHILGSNESFSISKYNGVIKLTFMIFETIQGEYWPIWNTILWPKDAILVDSEDNPVPVEHGSAVLIFEKSYTLNYADQTWQIS